MKKIGCLLLILVNLIKWIFILFKMVRFLVKVIKVNFSKSNVFVFLFLEYIYLILSGLMCIFV